MPMYRIVGQQQMDGKKFGGVIMEGTRLDNSWDVSIFEVNGHRELSARPVVEWDVVCDYEDRHKLPCFDIEVPLTEEEIAERADRSLKKAAQRAQTKCRRLIKACDFREMLTGTYRENQTDLELFKRHLTAFIDAMQYVLPKWRYCLSFEKQERGAYHFHCATNKLPRFVRYKGKKIEGWTLPTAVWRGIVGEDNGLVFVGGKPRWGTTRRRNNSIAKIAAYVSKYIMKDYADAPMGSKRYWSSRAPEWQKPTRLRLDNTSLRELVEVCFELPPGHSIVSHRIGHWGDTYWLCTEPGEPRPPALH
jgi:hypothetical protein